eukprot:SAG25_NODE_786_length_5332_cov_175.941525_5_plen_82_part_00
MACQSLGCWMHPATSLPTTYTRSSTRTCPSASLCVCMHVATATVCGTINEQLDLLPHQVAGEGLKIAEHCEYTGLTGLSTQ